MMKMCGLGDDWMIGIAGNGGKKLGVFPIAQPVLVQQQLLDLVAAQIVGIILKKLPVKGDGLAVAFLIVMDLRDEQNGFLGAGLLSLLPHAAIVGDSLLSRAQIGVKLAELKMRVACLIRIRRPSRDLIEYLHGPLRLPHSLQGKTLLE